MDGLFDENRLDLDDFPLWIIACRNTLEPPTEPGGPHGIGNATLFPHVETAEGKMLPVFTDGDLAIRFVQRQNDPNAQPMGLPDLASLLAMFRLALMRGFVIAGFDVSGVQGENIKWREKIADFLKRYEDEQ